MLELERILENKPIRPPAISTLALRWQSAGPTGQPGSGNLCGVESPKEEEISIGEESKEASKVGFCEIQWHSGTLDKNNKLIPKQIDMNTDTNIDPIRINLKNSASSSNLNFNNVTSNLGALVGSKGGRNERQLECNKSIDSIENVGVAHAECGSGGGGGDEEKSKPIKRNTSLISFKSLDFNLKTIYSSMKSKHGRDSATGSKSGTASSSKTSISKPPYLRVETVDIDETETLLTYPQSPYAQHRGSFDRSGYQHLNPHPDYSRSQASSPSPFLSISTPPNIRRSSTSDIMDKSHPGQQSHTDSRRPSTSDLLRRARERKDSGGAKMGRSVSQGGMPRGRAGRRTSMAF